MLLARILATAAAATVFAVSTSAAAGVLAIAAPVITSSGNDAQSASMSVSGSVLTQGSTATISYFNPALAGQWVCIEIDNGSRRHPLSTTVEIQLDACGRGTGTWIVDCWDVAKFNGPGCAEVTCAVTR